VKSEWRRLVTEKMKFIKLTSYQEGSIGDLDIYLNTKCIKLIERSVVHGDETGTRIELFGIPSSYDERNPIWVFETPNQILSMIEKTEGIGLITEG